MVNSNSYDTKNIVFFDGVCGMCNSLVNRLMTLDSKNRLLFSPLQGETAAQLLPDKYTKDLNTFVFWKQGKLYQKSSAALQLFATTKGYFKVLLALYIIPGFLRNTIYNFVAKRRYKWFGKKESCRIPTPEERAKFLP